MKRTHVILAALIVFCVLFGGLAARAFSERQQQVEQLTSLRRQHALFVERQVTLNVDETVVELAETDLWLGNSTSDPTGEMQAYVLDALSGFDLEMRRFQQLPPRNEDGAQRISLRIEAAGALEDVLSFIRMGEVASPPFVVSNLTVRALSERDQIDGTTQVSAQLTLWGYGELAQ